jgi:hypothetical protein
MTNSPFNAPVLWSDLILSLPVRILMNDWDISSLLANLRTVYHYYGYILYMKFALAYELSYLCGSGLSLVEFI